MAAPSKDTKGSAFKLTTTGPNQQIDGGNGADIIDANLIFTTTGGVYTIAAGNGDDIVWGSARDEIIWGDSVGGGSTSDNGADQLHGGGGIDQIHGGNGDDKLWGDAGKDVLLGDAGADQLTGGADGDTMTGGKGADKFIYLAASDSAAAAGAFSAATGDTITDFSRAGGDKLDFSALTGSGGGALKWAAGAAANSVWATATQVFADTTGDGVADLVINVKGVGSGDILGITLNSAPTVTSGGTASVNENAPASTVIYTATASDPDAGDTIAWSLTGADAALLSIDAVGNVTLNASADYETKSSYSFTVVATDGGGLADTQDVVLSVNNVDEVAPTFTSSTTAAAIDENSGAGQMVYDADASDPATDGGPSNPLVYSLGSLGGNEGAFSINPTTGEVTLTGNPDADTKSSYSFEVVATDTAGNSSSQTVSLAINNLNDNPVVGPADTDGASGGSIAENSANGTAVGITASASDADLGATVSYTLTDNAGGRFAIDGTSGVVTVANGSLLDAESATTHNITVLATSSDGSTNSQTFAIAVTNVDDNPVVGPADTDGASGGSIAENSANGTAVGITASASDADLGATVSYTLTDNAGGRFAIDGTSGVVTVANGSLLDAESATTHNITVLATSSDGSTNSQTFAIAVTNVDDNPVVGPADTDGASGGSIAENSANGTAVGITASASDADLGATVSYTLTDNAGGRFAIDGTSGVVTVANGSLLDAESATTHNITVLATSSDGSTNSQTFAIAVTNVDDNPVVGPADTDGASGGSIAENSANGTAVGITASASDADLGATVSYTLTDNAGGRFAIDGTSGVVTVANGSLLDAESATTHNITVLATSSDGSTNSQTFAIAVTNVDDNPVVGPADTDGASGGSIAENSANGTAVGITASASDADLGATVSYTLTDNAGGRFAIDGTSGVVTVANGSLLDAESATTHNITVLATSSDGSTNSQTFAIAVTNVDDNPVVGPADTDGASGGSIAENSANGTAVGITASASDADLGATVSYTLTDNAGGRFAIDGTSGVVTVANGSLLDAESATTHNITVLATSSDGSTNSQTFAIAVTNVDDNPVVGPADTDGASGGSIAENSANGTAVGITASASDADLGATVSYTLTDNAGGRFAIDGTSGVVTVANGSLLDAESATTHNITVLATSSDGSTNSQTFAIAVTNVDDNPVVGPADTDGASGGSIAENSANGTAVGITASASDADLGATVSYTLTDNAGGRFAIDGTSGVVTVANGSLLDAESATTHNITVLATSSDGSTNSQTFAIAVTNVDDNPVVGPADTDGASGGSIAENSANGTAVGITASASDADLGATVSYTLTDNAGGRFAIDGTSGVVTVANGSLLDAESATTHNITVLATSSDGSTNSQTFAIAVTNVDDNPVVGPADTDGASGGSIAENSANGTAVGITASASDADLGATVSYTLTDNAGGRFAIDGTSGVVTVANGSLLDAESATTHNITVLATSSDGSTNSQTFAIAVTNVDDNPVVGPADTDGASGGSIAENSANGTAVGITASASDADLGATVSYTLTDNAGGRFAIDGTSGVVTVANGSLLNYEAATSHNITVLATSSDGSTNSQTFTVSLTNVDEAPSAVSDTNGTANSVSEIATVGTAVGITASATDPEGVAITYSLSDDAGGRFAINASTGVVTVASGLDFEFATSHNITVVASDLGGLTSSQTFAVAVTNVTGGSDTSTTYTWSAPTTTDVSPAISDNAGLDRLVIDTSGATLTLLSFVNAGNTFGGPTSGSELVITIDGAALGEPDGDGQVQNHYAVANTIEYVTFSGGATYLGYSLGSSTYVLSNDITSPLTGDTTVVTNDIIASDGTGQTLTGGAGNDLLFGNAGTDTLDGGAGRDLLVGGADADTFDFNLTSDSTTNSSTADVIADFIHGTDFIDLTGIDANTGVGGDQNFTAFTTTTATANSVWYTEDVANNRTIVSMDNNGNTTADMIIVLQGITLGLTGTDFHL